MMTLETIAKQAWLADSKAAVLEALRRVERETAGEVERLREDKDGAYWKLQKSAMEQIASLQAEVERLREALNKVCDTTGGLNDAQDIANSALAAREVKP